MGSLLVGAYRLCISFWNIQSNIFMWFLDLVGDRRLVYSKVGHEESLFLDSFLTTAFHDLLQSEPITVRQQGVYGRHGSLFIYTPVNVLHCV